MDIIKTGTDFVYRPAAEETFHHNIIYRVAYGSQKLLCPV